MKQIAHEVITLVSGTPPSGYMRKVNLVLLILRHLGYPLFFPPPFETEHAARYHATPSPFVLPLLAGYSLSGNPPLKCRCLFGLWKG